MINIAGTLVNPDHISSAEVVTRDYMNGSTHTLVVRLLGGKEIRKEHGYGFNGFAELDHILEVTKK